VNPILAHQAKTRPSQFRFSDLPPFLLSLQPSYAAAVGAASPSAPSAPVEQPEHPLDPNAQPVAASETEDAAPAAEGEGKEGKEGDGKQDEKEEFKFQPENPVCLLGVKISVLWAQGRWYEGKVEKFDEKTGKLFVQYVALLFSLEI
jgi:hypothetical protein